MKILQPVQCIVDEVFTNTVAPGIVKVDRIPPWRAIFVGEIWTIPQKAISFWPKMIIDHIEKDGESLRMASVYEPLQTVRTAIGILYGIRENTIVSPVPFAGKLRHGHQLQRVDAERKQIIKAGNDGVKSSLISKRAHVKFVQYKFAKRNAAPGIIRPAESIVVDDLGGSMYGFRLIERHRVGQIIAIVGYEVIPPPGRQG